MKRREYLIKITVNGLSIKRAIIDSHYERKHGGSMTDEIILRLVRTLDGEEHYPDKIVTPYLYFQKDMIRIDSRFYRLVWLLEMGQSYIGVINAYRR